MLSDWAEDGATQKGKCSVGVCLFAHYYEYFASGNSLCYKQHSPLENVFLSCTVSPCFIARQFDSPSWKNTMFYCTGFSTLYYRWGLSHLSQVAPSTSLSRLGFSASSSPFGAEKDIWC
jgi:hypothetical protein